MMKTVSGQTDAVSDPSTENIHSTVAKPIPIVRSIIAGFFMGLANLVPGISGGTMILVMGLYDEFIRDIADVTRLKFSRRNITFLIVVAVSAVTAIALFAGVMSRAVAVYPSAMFSLFIGLTLGGVPLLIKMIQRINTPVVVGMILGFAMIVGIAMNHHEPPNKDEIRESIKQGQFILTPAYSTDVAAGVLGMSAMILPGISGAYMLLVLHRYETILAAVAMTKDYVFSMGDKGNLADILQIIVPVSIGSILGLILLSNFLKWMLRKHENLMVGLLLGVLTGSIVGIWPFDQTSSINDLLFGSMLAVIGFISTALLSRISA